MPSVKAEVTGAEELKRALKKMTPEQNKQILVKSLRECADNVLDNAKKEQIIGGGRQRRAKLFGTGTKLISAAPHPFKLTSRTNRLRDSISVNTSPLPFAIEVGTDVVYGPVHELGIAPMPKRPFLKPGVEAVEDRFPEVFMRNWRRVGGMR